MLLPQILFLAVASAEAETATPVVGLDTALLIVIAVILVFLFRALADLRGRIDELESAVKHVTGARHTPPPAEDTIPVHIVAAIAAAVVATVDFPHRIVAMRPITPESRAWSLEGRREIFLSHRVR